MSISRVTTWSSGQVLTASALNGEFNNIINNALSLISPLTGTLNVNSNDLTSVDEITFGDGAANPTTSGGLRRNGDAITWLLTGSHTNTVKNVAHLIANTSGTPAAGIGTGLLFSSESADEDPSNVGALQFAASDVGAGTEDTYLDVLIRIAGAALVAAYRLQATGAFKGIFTHANTADRTYTLPDASGTVQLGAVATQAEMETATSTSVLVSPGRTQYHPGVAKAWVRFTPAGANEGSYNVANVDDDGTGDWGVNFTTAFSAAGTYTGTLSILGTSASRTNKQAFDALNTTSAEIISYLDADGLANEDGITSVLAIFYGDQA